MIGMLTLGKDVVVWGTGSYKKGVCMVSPKITTNMPKPFFDRSGASHSEDMQWIWLPKKNKRLQTNAMNYVGYVV